MDIRWHNTIRKREPVFVTNGFSFEGESKKSKANHAVISTLNRNEIRCDFFCDI
jgi:hypothetical protein